MAIARRKKVFIIAGDLNPNDLGGAEKHVVETLPHLAEKNYEFHLFVGPKDDIKILYEKYPNIIVHTISYPGVQNLYSLSYILFSIPHIYRFLKENKIDLIWSKEVFPMGISAGILKKLTGIPLYMTTQNPYCYKEEMIIVNKFLPKPLQRIIQYFLGPFVSLGIKQSDYMGAVSTYSQSLAYKMGAKKCDVTPNGIEISRFPLKEKILNIETKRKINLISTSFFIPRNAIDILLKAFAQLRKRDRYELTLTSAGPLFSEMKKLATLLKINKQVKFLGMQPPGMIPKLLAQSDIFIRPSRAEGFGISFIEAMSTGVPVITCPSGGIIDFITDEKTGLLVEPNNPEQVAKAIERLSKSDAIYSRLVKNGRKIIEDRYSWVRIADQLDKIFIKLLT